MLLNGPSTSDDINCFVYWLIRKSEKLNTYPENSVFEM